MILKITRQTINNNNVIKTFEPYVVQCTRFEFDAHILPRLKELVAVNNLHYDLINSDNKCQYHIQYCVIEDYLSFNVKANNLIDTAHNKYNQLVNGVNVAIKRSNKVNNRHINTGLLKTIDREVIKIGAKGTSLTEDEDGRMIVR